MVQHTEAAPGIALDVRRLVRYVPWTLAVAAIVFALVWVLFAADNAAVHDVGTFIRVMLDGITLAGLLFVVASGFTLIFGLMRVVNMAHGSFFLLGGYIALRLQRDFVGGDSTFGLLSSQVSFANWILPLVIAAVCIAVVGLVMQQVFLRWNQGQDLRQALITIAISIILADQMLAHFGGIAEDIAWPGTLDRFVNLHVFGVQYAVTRLFILGLALAIGVALWLWLKKTRTGMVIRAGVDDRAMVSALGINIQLVFAIAFVVGSALAGLGGVVGGSFASLAPGVDANWLLNSLVVVIIGGMGSLGGAAVGALLYGLVTNLSATYLPADYTFYSIIFTFVLLAIVLAVRPLGLFGRPA
ncbi:MAG: branched-chain amino acid ABC transporter permease [Actinomycetota bacterium]|nr:branched-chain amino acid ABC transporter permease [Actinomycetota bacterium]